MVWYCHSTSGCWAPSGSPRPQTGFLHRPLRLRYPRQGTFAEPAAVIPSAMCGSHNDGRGEASLEQSRVLAGQKDFELHSYNPIQPLELCLLCSSILITWRQSACRLRGSLSSNEARRWCIRSWVQKGGICRASAGNQCHRSSNVQDAACSLSVVLVLAVWPRECFAGRPACRQSSSTDTCAVLISSAFTLPTATRLSAHL